ncbi:MAG: hypothetical protein WCD89_04345 [Anaerocolumna sp.]
MGHNLTLKDFGNVTGSKLKLELTKQFDSEYYTPSMTEIQVYNDAADDGVPSDTQPVLVVTSGS